MDTTKLQVSYYWPPFDVATKLLLVESATTEERVCREGKPYSLNWFDVKVTKYLSGAEDSKLIEVAFFRLYKFLLICHISASG